MSIFACWDNLQKSVIQVVFEKDWTWADFVEAENQIEAMLDSVEWHVHLIADMRGANRLPTGMAFTDLIDSFSSENSNLGTVVIVGGGNVLQMLLRTTQRLAFDASPNHIRFADDLHGARTLLRSVLNVRETLKESVITSEHTAIH
jgi:hypothetical protein